MPTGRGAYFDNGLKRGFIFRQCPAAGRDVYSQKYKQAGVHIPTTASNRVVYSGNFQKQNCIFWHRCIFLIFHILLQCPKTGDTNSGHYVHESEWVQHSSCLLLLAIIVVSLEQTQWTFGSFTGKANEAIVMGNGFNILLLGYVVHRIAEEYPVCLWQRIVSNFFRGVRCSLKWSETTLRRINTLGDLGVIALSGWVPFLLGGIGDHMDRI